ncbi:MAG: glycoside hydrolase family 43 protein [Clostridiales bacterium]|nr:glycoside hydrolase family 43 protein [Clostridiales bacterium]
MPMKLKQIVGALLAAVLGGISLAGAAETATPNQQLPTPRWQDVAVHDPSIIKADDGFYYIYGSHMAAAKSEDLIKWKLISRDATNGGCTLVKEVQTEMKEALSYARTTTFWAPDVVQLADGRYYMYYCTCEGSSPLATLGYAVSDRPEGPYENLGIILRSGYGGYNATVLPNVIDPCLFYDKEDRLWMVYGSYSGGIYILEMDKVTGLPLEGQLNGGYGKKLLGGNHARIEAPYILYSPDTDYYYLFLSFGGLGQNDGYNIRVCRSRTPDGPYEDALGQNMIRCAGRPGTFFNDPDYAPYGVKLMGGYEFLPLETDKNKFTQGFRSPGHNSAYYDEEMGRYFIIFHTRFTTTGEAFSVRVHQMYMTADGWPVVSPMRYANEMPQPVSEDAMSGVYKVLLHGRDINKVEHESEVITLHADGTVSGALTGTWACTDGVNVTMTLEGLKYTGVMHTALEAGQKNWATCISAIDENGASLWAVRGLNQE